QRRRAQGRDHWRSDDRLRDDDGRATVEEVELTERPRAPEHDRDEKADGDRRQGHPGVEGAERESAAGRCPEGEERGDAQAENERNERSATRDEQRGESDLIYVAVAGEDEAERFSNAIPD